MDESGSGAAIEKSEPSFENEDESDQAKASLFSVYYSFFLSSRSLCILSLFCSITWKAMRSTI